MTRSRHVRPAPRRRTSANRLGSLGGAIVLTPWLGLTCVFAQSGGSTPPDPAVAPVTVVGRAPDDRSTIDRRIYSLANDLQKRTGSLADVLGHIPSVQVDPDGAVSLRGDRSVTIYVDGKPSALFSGPGRAQALQSISADRFDRVEVMTNPSAAQTAEGGGGVIDLISKVAPKAGAAPTASGTTKADIGSNGRFDLGVDGAYGAPGLSLTGGVGLRRSGYGRDLDTRYGLPDPATGALDPADQRQAQVNHTQAVTLYGTGGYDIDPHDHLDAGFDATDLRIVESHDSRYRSGAASGPLALDFSAPGYLHSHFASESESLGVTHTFSGSDQRLSGKISLGQNTIAAQNIANYSFRLPAQADLYQDLVQTAAFPDLDMTIDYATTLSDKAKLTLGYEFRIDRQSEGNQSLQGASAGLAAVDPTFAQDFKFRQQVHALYLTYEQTFGKLTLQPGLRVERTTIATDLLSAHRLGSQNYTSVYPSLHVEYALDDSSQLNASYGRRVLRPDESQLDPFPIYQGSTLYSAGNPNLRPTYIASYELGYEYSKKSTDFRATLFQHDRFDVITTVTQDVGANTLLSTFQNLPHGGDVGLELVAKRDLSRTLSLSGSTDLIRSEVDPEALDPLGRRTANTSSGQVTLNWKVTRRDVVQLGGEASGRQLTAQGYEGGVLTSDFGWRHRFDARLASTFTVTDPFGLSRRTTVIDTPTLSEVEHRKFDAVAVFFGLTFAFDATPKHAADTFDFGSRPQAKP